MLLNGALQSLGRQNLVRFRPNKLHRTLWPSGIATSQPSRSVVREVCVPNRSSSLTMPRTYQGAWSCKPVEVENASIVVVDVAFGVSGCSRWSSANCGEHARKSLRVRGLRWSWSCSLGTVDPSRKLRRFESFTCHHVLERASDDLRKRGSEALFVYLAGVSKWHCFGDPLRLAERRGSCGPGVARRSQSGRWTLDETRPVAELRTSRKTVRDSPRRCPHRFGSSCTHAIIRGLCRGCHRVTELP